jgi:Tetratricopeptide repeat
MKRGFLVVLVAAGCLMAAARLSAQAQPAQSPPADASQKPPATPAKPAESNPFPTDTTDVPLMPSKDAPALPEGTYSGADSERVKLPGQDVDPVRSPDDAAPDDDSAQPMNFSSSSAGLDKILPGPDDDSQPQGGKRRKLAVPGPEHQETSAEDIEVGKYELDNHNWKAALSRFESAMVLAPDEPEVYWGLAESERHLGNFADARTYYQKVVLYDPDSKHGKEAMKALKEPEIAKARAAAPAPAAK